MSEASTLDLESTPRREEEERIHRKVTLRIVPFIFICYLAAYLDRVNVGFAKLQMLHELNFSETIYGFGAGIFFLGYVLFEVPSNVIMHKVGARLWIARIMITWGLISGSMIFVHTPLSFYVLRFLLGVAEAGFIPGVLLYLTYWFPANRRGRITAVFLTAIPMASIFGGPLSGWILNKVSGAQGLSGWQWLFLVETIPSLILGVVTLLYLDDRVASAKWLHDDERRIIAENIAREEDAKAAEGHSHMSAAFGSPRVWLLGLIYFCIASGIYIISFWLPTLIKQSGVADPLTIGLLTALPYIVAVVAMISVNSHADHVRERRWHTLIPCFVTASGLVLTAWAANNTLLAMAGLILATAGASTAQSSCWTFPSAFLGGAAAAAGIALVNSLGNIAGFASTFLVGWMSDLTHSNSASLYLFATLIAIGGALILAVPARLVNK
jgi:D-galactonate transporter